MTGDEQGDRVAAIHDHLAATQELPVETTASRWIGEAEAVAGDLVGADVDAGVLRERVGHVRNLLEQVDETGHPAADEHVERAADLAADLLDAIDDA